MACIHNLPIHLNPPVNSRVGHVPLLVEAATFSASIAFLSTAGFALGEQQLGIVVFFCEHFCKHAPRTGVLLMMCLQRQRKPVLLCFALRHGTREVV